MTIFKMAALGMILVGFLALKVCGETDLDGLTGGWKPASLEESMKFYSNICNIPKVSVDKITKDMFEREFKTKPFILTFPNGAKDWVESDYWTLENLTGEYEDWKLSAGKSIDIVYNGGRGDTSRTFREYVDEMRTNEVPAGDFTYLFDRYFFYNSSLPDTISVPEFLFKEGDPILFIGPSGTGATWHKHMPAWNGVVFGQKRWFVYPNNKTPPGGLYSYTPIAWLNYVYPKLKPEDKPLECIQNGGEIFYVPESYYHAILNIGETVAISIQSKNVTTASEAEFYKAMDSHYLATTVEDESMVKVHYDAADKRYTDLHFLYPYNTEILAHLSEIACERGDTVRCERVLTHLIDLDMFAINSLKLRSRIYYDKKKEERCERDLLTALAIHPLSKEILREYANLLWNIRKPQSRKAFEKLLSVLDPETEEAEGVRETLKTTDFGPSGEVIGPPKLRANADNAIEIQSKDEL